MEDEANYLAGVLAGNAQGAANVYGGAGFPGGGWPYGGRPEAFELELFSSLGRRPHSCLDDEVQGFLRVSRGSWDRGTLLALLRLVFTLLRRNRRLWCPM